MTFSGATLHSEIAALLPRLRRFARTIAWQREAADDLVQLGIERALQRSNPFEAGTRLDCWLFRLIKNSWTDDARSGIRREQVFSPEEAGEQVDNDHGEAQQQNIAIRKAISQLADDHRIVIGLVLVDGLSYKDAAGVLDTPVGTLSSRLARARAALQGILSDQARTVS
jgi:RNA polymerase sigma-70 factor (ECF subfamily)